MTRGKETGSEPAGRIFCHCRCYRVSAAVDFKSEEIYGSSIVLLRTDYEVSTLTQSLPDQFQPPWNIVRLEGYVSVRVHVLKMFAISLIPNDSLKTISGFLIERN